MRTSFLIFLVPLFSLSSDQYTANYIIISFVSRLHQFRVCSSIHHIGAYFLIICSFGLYEYPCVTSYDLMLLLGNMNTLDLVIMCLFSRFLYLTRSIYFTGLSDGVSVYVYSQYAYLFYRYFKPHIYLFNLIFILYEYSYVGS